MQLEAMWTLEYTTNHGDFGSGVAVLVDGRIYGGDSVYCYEGSYRRRGDRVEAQLSLCVHNVEAAAPCALNGPVTLYLNGVLEGTELALQGQLEHDPTTRLCVQMARKSGVPLAQVSDAPAVADSAVRPATPSAGGDANYLIGETTDRLPFL